MAMIDFYGDEGRGDYWNYDQTPTQSQNYGPTDPPARSPDPGNGNYGLIPTQAVNPETGFAWNSKEDLEATNKKYGGAQGGQTAEDWLKQYQAGNNASEGLDRTLQGLKASGYAASNFMYGNTPSNNELTIGGEKRKIIGGEETSNPFWYEWGSDDSGGGGGGGGGGNGGGGGDPWGGGAGGGGTYSNRGIFDDPATVGWMKLLMERINRLNQPYQPPSMKPLTDYLSSYFQRLQGPAYTPQQLDLLQTQSLDPLSRERDAVRQRIIEQASRRGLSPQSGIVQKQISDAENQFEQIRTKTQAGFAAKAVDLDRINAQQAASVGQLLANIEQANFNQNEQRANQALGYAQQVPDLARQRMLDANAILSQSQINPAQLLQMSMQQGQYDSGQQQQYIMGLAQMLPQLLKIFGVGA